MTELFGCLDVDSLTNIVGGVAKFKNWFHKSMRMGKDRRIIQMKMKATRVDEFF